MVRATLTRAPALIRQVPSGSRRTSLGVVDGLVFAFDDEAALEGGELEGLGGVAQAEAVVEAAGAVLGEDEVGGAGLEEVRHRDEGERLLGGAALEAVLAGGLGAEPGAGEEVGGDPRRC
jgi:hypothetical protein